MDLFFWGIILLLILGCVLFIFRSFLRLQNGGVFNASRDAIQRGDQNALHNAPIPESTSDIWIDRIIQVFILNQYDKVARIWFEYRSGFGERKAAQKIKMLEYEKERSKLQADTADQRLRKAQAIHEQERLWEAAPQEEDSTEQRKRELKEKIRRQEEHYLPMLRSERAEAENIEDETVRDETLNHYDVEIRRGLAYLLDLKRELASFE
jgi:hypothetical protein